MIVESPPRQVEPRWVRISLAAAGVIAIVTSVVLAFSWIDTGDDSTCSSVVNPGDWWGSDACRGIMAVRTVLVALLFAAGCGLVAVAFAHRLRRRAAATIAAAVLVVVSLTALVVNEAVRSGGLGR